MNAALPGAPMLARRPMLVSFLLTATVFVLTMISIGSRPDEADWSVWRPGSGVAVGVAAWYSGRNKTQMAAAAGVGTFFGALATGRDPWLCLGGAVTAGIEAWIASRILQGRDGQVPVLSGSNGVQRLFGATAAVGVVTAICFGLTAGLVLGWNEVGPTMLALVPSHMSGVLVVAPLFFASPPRSPRVSPTEKVLQWAVVIAITAGVFRFTDGLPLAFLMVPPLIWGASRLQYRPFMIQLVLTAFAISLLTSFDFGTFGPDTFQNFAPLLMAAFLFTIALLAYTIIAATAHARGLRTLLDVQAEALRRSIEFSPLGIGTIREVDGSLVIADLNAAGTGILKIKSSAPQDLSELVTDAGASMLRTAFDGLGAELPAVWNTALLETQSDRLLEVSLVALGTGFSRDLNADPITSARPEARAASFQFVDVTDREHSKALQQAELDRAAEIQQALTPKLDVTIPYYQIAARSAPARVIGGDFYDFYADAGACALTLGDVMGKGIGAALVASALRMSMRLETASLPPAAALNRSAQAIESEMSSASMFATVFTAQVDMITGQVRYVDAGHGLAVICRDGSLPTQLDSRGLPLGVAAEKQWVEKTAQLDPGDTLVVFSDGLLDLFDGTLSVFTEIDRVSRLFNTVEEVLTQLFRNLDPEAITDDVTAIAIRREVPDSA